MATAGYDYGESLYGDLGVGYGGVIMTLEANVRIALTEEAQLTITVEDARTGDPIAGAAVHVAGANTDVDATAETGDDGQVVFEGIRQDEYTVTASKETEPRYIEQEVTVAPGDFSRPSG